MTNIGTPSRQVKAGNGTDRDPRDHRTGLFILGALYPTIVGGMEVFNYHFLNQELDHFDPDIVYLSDEPTSNKKGHFRSLRKWKPVRLFYPFQFFWFLARERRKFRYAYIAYAEQSWILSYAQALSLKSFGIPYHVTIHWGTKPAWKFRHAYEYFFRNATSVIGVSEDIVRQYEEALPGKKVLYIPPLIPFRRSDKPREQVRAAFGHGPDDKVIVFVGSLKGMKNPDTLVEALRLLHERGLTRTKLIMAGKGELSDTLSTYVRENQLADAVQFPGLVSQEAMPDLYAAADAYVIASDYEGTSISLLEAMYNSLPIVATDVRGINKMIADERNGLLVPRKDATAMADALARIFTDQPLASRLGEQARKDYDQKYSYEQMTRTYNDLFTGAGKS